MGEREARWVGEAAGRAVQHLGHHGEGADRACADARDQQQRGEIPGAALGGGGEGGVEAPRDDVARPHLVMRRHGEMRQPRLRRRR